MKEWPKSLVLRESTITQTLQRTPLGATRAAAGVLDVALDSHTFLLCLRVPGFAARVAFIQKEPHNAERNHENRYQHKYDH